MMTFEGKELAEAKAIRSAWTPPKNLMFCASSSAFLLFDYGMISQNLPHPFTNLFSRLGQPGPTQSLVGKRSLGYGQSRAKAADGR